MTASCRLYLITPPEIADLAGFIESLKAALAGGDVACLQLRLKTAAGVSASDDEVLRAAEAILKIARPAEVHFLINDRPDLAKRAGADGVHIGQSDGGYQEARALLGREPTIGVTCHNSVDLAISAGEAGADYVAFGAFFPTRTKEAPTRADISLIENWTMATTVPCVAIGGVTAENCGGLVAAGADFLAVSSAVWDAADGPEKAVARLNKAIAAAAPARHD
ncbi:MAG: thiamine-phosphate diphosphorylase [Alphaproteobacteria bacterium RIFCSPHIGHO2_12_FULL_63_12]|nr:MAG: thiamine-phosphate diphosphorylase [Alphaproteobacteria bacterium RIFCSPHIGHO2_12_FULL_63_12]